MFQNNIKKGEDEWFKASGIIYGIESGEQWTW